MVLMLLVVCGGGEVCRCVMEDVLYCTVRYCTVCRPLSSVGFELRNPLAITVRVFCGEAVPSTPHSCLNPLSCPVLLTHSHGLPKPRRQYRQPVQTIIIVLPHTSIVVTIGIDFVTVY